MESASIHVNTELTSAIVNCECIAPGRNMRINADGGEPNQIIIGASMCDVVENLAKLV